MSYIYVVVMFFCLCWILTDAGLTSSVIKEPSEFEAFLPFGSGARACIGQKLAVLGISSLFAALVGHYEVCTSYLLFLPVISVYFFCL